MYLYLFCMCVYVYMYSCVILNNSALKFSRGRGHEARPWKPILQSLRNIFRYIQKRPLDPLTLCLDEELRVYHAL